MLQFKPQREAQRLSMCLKHFADAMSLWDLKQKEFFLLVIYCKLWKKSVGFVSYRSEL